MVGNSFKNGEKVGKDEALFNGAYLFLKSLNVSCFHFVSQGIDNLFKRLNTPCKGDVLCFKGSYRKIKYIFNSLEHYLKLTFCHVGELKVCACNILVLIYAVLVVNYHLGLVLIVVLQDIECDKYSILCEGSHSVGNVSALLDSNAGSAEETVVQKNGGFAVVLHLVTDSEVCQLFKQVCEGEQQQGGADIEYCMHQCD